MGNIEFAWDSRKAASNLAKQRVSFEEARSVFPDENARLIDDPDHSSDEERSMLLGYSFGGNCLAVVHCYRQSGFLIRLIPARRATAHEERAYYGSFQ